MGERNHHRKRNITLPPSMKKNDRLASTLIVIVSLVVFVAVVLLDKIKIELPSYVQVHMFAALNALINTFVALLLIGGLWAAKDKRFKTHKHIMLWAIRLSVLFLVSYICHHLFSGSTPYQGSGFSKPVYYFILITHISLAGIVLPLILFTAYRALIGEYSRHRKLAKITWPIWFYVAVTGVIVYFMIKPYYN